MIHEKAISLTDYVNVGRGNSGGAAACTDLSTFEHAGWVNRIAQEWYPDADTR
jgi:hypothetical protein